MAKLHLKGFILCLLKDNATGLWDYEIVDRMMKEYNRKGAYWKAEVRVTLTDLLSGALIKKEEDALDDGKHFAPDKLLMKVRLTPFGEQRMKETGLL